MKTYFALSYSPVHEIKIWDRINLPTVLSSYFVLKGFPPEKIKNMFTDRDSFLDSGAFTAFTKEIDINIDQYINFIKASKSAWNTYATLDVIGDYQATRVNTEYIESKGLTPLPVFHYGSPDKELKRLINKYDYIALGGLVPLSLQRNKMQGWLDYCFSIIKNKTKIHGFGVNSLWAWKRYPFYSVDATSWNQGMKFGRVLSNEGLNSKNISGNKAIYLNKGSDWRYRTRLNIRAYNNMAKDVTKLWEARGITWK